ncbi:hypothetical protein [Oricola sp.]|uniref:sulfotransferase-like domain-containing protein n=1 Tax=Oricola sp. TaxID=1979950 RepID=UPI0025F8048A|nr:hypothetical protein [Oricola sp.]MCI5077861.1 sulfotransferase [Oricola sp.]
MPDTKIIAMWSGPRNLSTAMMRAFGNRADCIAMDEPFYGAYLAASGADHPMRDEVMASMQCDPQNVATQCRGPFATPLCYQKHMPHHMLEGFPLDWAASATNVFLIRHPRRVLASYAKKKESVSEADIGYRRMLEIDRHVSELTGRPPVVVASEDILVDPEGVLTALCAAIGIPFDPAMLAWDKGPRPEDGVWGRHWYDAIWQSTGFSKPASMELPPELPEHLARVEAQALPAWEAMAARSVSPA